MRARQLTPALLLALVLTGCTVTTSDAPEPETAVSTPVVEEAPSTAPSVEPEPEPEEDRHEVPWQDYDAALQPRIDDLTNTADCTALQAEFDTADANNDATMARTGHNNVDLMTYIDEALQLANCY